MPPVEAVPTKKVAEPTDDSAPFPDHQGSFLGLRLPTSWREVYYKVVIVFVLWVVLLTLLPYLFA